MVGPWSAWLGEMICLITSSFRLFHTLRRGANDGFVIADIGFPLVRMTFFAITGDGTLPHGTIG